MTREYEVTRKLQEQSGSYFVVLPKIWVESLGLEQGDPMSVIFNGIVTIKPPSGLFEEINPQETPENCDSGSPEGVPLSHALTSEGGEIG